MHCHVVEVGPRDGLQNEARMWSVDHRVHLINLLSQCGFSEIEVGSFVSPKWVPQMQDTDRVYQRITQNPMTRYATLVPNERGLDAALACGVRDISVFTAASEAFCQKNIHCTIEESLERFARIIEKAHQRGLSVRGYVSCVVACPYTGVIAAEDVARVAERLEIMGCREISLGDTIGHGTPDTISAMVRCVRKTVSVEKLAIHCHDTQGQAIDNIAAAVREGVCVIDSSINGLGGCPYAGPDAKGNVATQQVVAWLGAHGYAHDVDLIALDRAAQWVTSVS